MIANYHTDAEYLALLERIRTYPADDAPRLILSDWLEEHGEDERAEFIRLSVELSKIDLAKDDEDFWLDPDTQNLRSRADDIIKRNWSPWSHPRALYIINFHDGYVARSTGVRFNRGFVSEVRLTCREFMGGTCERCNGSGTLEAHSFRPPCRLCSGTGRIPGVARELFERHPITRVVLTDRECYRGNIWFQEGRFMTGLHPQSDIPKFLLDKMAEVKGWDVSSYIGYDTEAAALSALSDACVRYGRESVGLPAITLSQ